MSLNLVSQAQFVTPSAATSITLTSTTSAWGNAASFTEILSAISSASVLSGIVLRPIEGSQNWDIDCEIDIATGAASSEVVISTFRFTYTDVFGSDTLTGPVIFNLPIGINNIANNDRISARIRTSGTSTFTMKIAALYFKKPITGTYLTTANPVKTLPSAANSVTVTTNATTWLNGTYTQLRTNSGSALIILGLTIRGQTAGEYEIDIATGAAASEVVITTVHFSASATLSIPSFFPLPNPLDNVGVNIRVAARARGTLTGLGLRVALMVLEKPI
jgi:hypothetical protein